MRALALFLGLSERRVREPFARAKVGELQDAVVRDEHVRALHVAMDEVVRVQVHEAAQRLHRVLARDRVRQRAELRDERRDGAARDPLLEHVH